MFVRYGETLFGKREQCGKVFLGVFNLPHVQADGGDRVGFRLLHGDVPVCRK
jgi:hypothetical protein